MRYYSTLIRMSKFKNAGEDKEKLDGLYIAGGNMK